MLPHIICHMMCSVDGRIKVDRWTPAFDGSDLKTIVAPYATISREYNAQARMLGQNTVTLDFIKEVFDHENCPRPAHYQPYKGLLDTDRVCIVLDSLGKTLYRENNIGGERIIAVLGECVSEKYLEHLQRLGISYVFAGSDGTDFRKAFITLKAEYGINTIVHHGGGTSNGILL